MTIADAATPAIQLFEGDDAITMVAIAGAESAFLADAAGDDLSIFPPSLQSVYREWSDEGKCSFGLWQIFLPVHHAAVARMSGQELPAEMAKWLKDPLNNARVARYVLSNQGFRAWSTYNSGDYRRFINDAGAAVERAREAIKDGVARAIVAMSIASPHVHLDFDDGSYLETMLSNVEIFGPWLRFNVERNIVIKSFQDSR